MPNHGPPRRAYQVDGEREDYNPHVVGLIDPMIYDRFDMCPECKAQRMQLLSFNNINQDYRDAVDAYLSGYN
ncbi:MAG: hypothetical protein NC489_35750, partial [Ruminococcus flavefaciens]|nr:hypothetical protein [Ruminococcus flavefaciens]